ncbi:TIGR02391 family protein [Streptomyces brasiliscabiei]|uniref:TIGR02391 family protein n=1 Tax=Streptomyces brasiliscabiei TaxID=2736302 RepID=UPI001F3341CA|nr:TIGR02391 family protein [Streptomyces brasiliscabiei]
MDHTYAAETLGNFLDDVNIHVSKMETAKADQNGGMPWPDWPQDLAIELVLVRKIVEAYAPYALAELNQYTADGLAYWQLVRIAVAEALGHAKHADDIDAFLRPKSPVIGAESLHSWVWQPAAPLWAAEAHQDAVLAAARVVNRRLQLKLGRHDIGETDLCMQCFDTKPPAEGKPRLRFKGDRDTPTWKARQEGAKYLAAGAFLGIRNLAAHEEEVTWTQPEALEYLATFSVIARWIEECTVETVS